MASAIGQTASAVEANDTFVTTTATGSPTVTGSTFLILVQFKTARAITTVADNKSNTYTQIGTTTTSDGVKRAVYGCQNGTGGSGHTATITQDGSDSISAAFLEITGVATASLDVSATFNLDVASPFTSTATSTTTQAAEMAIAAIWISTFGATTITWGNSYTEAIKLVDGSLGVIAFGYLSLSSTGAQQSSVTVSAGTEVASLIATFKDSGGGGGPSLGPVTVLPQRNRRSSGRYM